MTTIQHITPILAKTVIGIATLTTVLSAAAVISIGATQLLLFTGFSMIAGLYGAQVLRNENTAAIAETTPSSDQILAA